MIWHREDQNTERTYTDIGDIFIKQLDNHCNLYSNHLPVFCALPDMKLAKKIAEEIYIHEKLKKLDET